MVFRVSDLPNKGWPAMRETSSDSTPMLAYAETSAFLPSLWLCRYQCPYALSKGTSLWLLLGPHKQHLLTQENIWLLLESFWVSWGPMKFPQDFLPTPSETSCSRTIYPSGLRGEAGNRFLLLFESIFHSVNYFCWQLPSICSSRWSHISWVEAPLRASSASLAHLTTSPCDKDKNAGEVSQYHWWLGQGVGGGLVEFS